MKKISMALEEYKWGQIAKDLVEVKDFCASLETNMGLYMARKVASVMAHFVLPDKREDL